MRFLVLLLAVAAISALRDDQPLISKAFTEYLKKTVSWEVVDYEDNIFKDWTVGDSRQFLIPYFGKKVMVESDASFNAPENFDPRKEKWANCIHPIRNQGKCGSCWAHGATETLSDRFCINGKDVILSPQDLTSCDTHASGCQGGQIDEPFRWMTTYGVVTDGCFPYVSGDGHVPPCAKKCENGETFIKYKCKPGSIIDVNSVAKEKEELYTHGPLNTGFNVYEDFKYYKSGIYEHKAGKYLGGHAVKVIGYGVEGGVSFWICSNSWSETWGEQGFFKIKIGQCDIDGGIACTPLI